MPATRSANLRLVPKRFVRVLVSLLSFGLMRTGPYRVLGVSRFASNEELKKTYHRLMRQYHPDRLSAASQHAHAINAAYEAIMKQRGLKKLAA